MHMEEEQSRQSVLQYPAQPPRDDDEISLIDLWLVLARRRRLVLGTVLACLGLGLAWAFLKTPEYRYWATIEIGSRIIGERAELLESPTSAAAKLRENYVPDAIHKYVDGGEKVDWIPEIDVSTPKDSGVIVLAAKSAREYEGAIAQLLSSAAQSLEVDHQRILADVRMSLESDAKAAANQLEELKGELEILESEKKRLAVREELLRTDIEETEKLLSRAHSRTGEAAQQVSDETRAMTMIMLLNEVRHTRARLSQLRQQLEVGLPQEKEELQKRIADNRRGQVLQEMRIEEIHGRIRNLRETKVLSEPQRSLGEQGPGNATIIALAMVLGIMFGILAAFFAEFFSKVRAQT